MGTIIDSTLEEQPVRSIPPNVLVLDFITPASEWGSPDHPNFTHIIQQTHLDPFEPKFIFFRVQGPVQPRTVGTWLNEQWSQSWKGMPLILLVDGSDPLVFFGAIMYELGLLFDKHPIVYVRNSIQCLGVTVDNKPDIVIRNEWFIPDDYSTKESDYEPEPKST